MPKVKILMSNRMMSRFAQDADLFEKSKVVIQAPVTATVVDDFGDSHIQAIQKKLEGSPYGLVAVFDPGGKVYYRNPDVNVISDGQQWIPLDDYMGVG